MIAQLQWLGDSGKSTAGKWGAPQGCDECMGDRGGGS